MKTQFERETELRDKAKAAGIPNEAIELHFAVMDADKRRWADATTSIINVHPWIAGAIGL